MSSIFMEYENEIIQFPVSPPELKIKREGNNEKEEVIKLGEVNIPKDAKLATTEFESFYPKEDSYSFITTKGKFQPPEFYNEFIDKVRKSKKPVRFIVTKTNINMLMLIDDYEYGYEAGDRDTNFTISLSEYKELTAKTVVIEKKEEPKKEVSTPRPAPVEKKVTIGCTVIVNGRLHRDSWGKSPGKTLKEYKGKINFVKDPKQRSHPYHVTNMKGGWMGWVIPSAVKVL